MRAGCCSSSRIRLPPRTHLWMEGEPEQYAELMEKNYGYQSLLKLALDPAKPAEPRIAALWILGRRDADVADAGLRLGRGVRRQGSGRPPQCRAASPKLRRIMTPASSAILSDAIGPAAQPMPTRSRGWPRCARSASQRATERRRRAKAHRRRLAEVRRRLPEVRRRRRGFAQSGGGHRRGARQRAIRRPDAADRHPRHTPSARQNDAAAAAKLVVALAGKPASADALKRSILDTLGKSLKDAPAMTPELSAALGQAARQRRQRQRAPLAAKWDKAGELAGESSAASPQG